MIVGIIRHYAYSCQHRLWRNAGVGEFGEKTLTGMHQDGLSKVGLVLGLRLGLGLVSLVPIYMLLWRPLNFSHPKTLTKKDFSR